MEEVVAVVRGAVVTLETEAAVARTSSPVSSSRGAVGGALDRSLVMLPSVQDRKVSTRAHIIEISMSMNMGMWI